MMGKTTLLVVTIFLFSVSLFAGANVVNVAKANPVPYQPTITLVLTPSQAESYNLSFVYNTPDLPDIPLNVTIQLLGDNNSGNLEIIDWLNYTIDGQTPIPMTVTYLMPLSSQYNATSSNVLSGLSGGWQGVWHNLVIQGETNYNRTIYADIIFKVQIPVQTEPTQTATPPPHGNHGLGDVTILIIAGLLALAVLVGVAVILKARYRNKMTE